MSEVVVAHTRGVANVEERAQQKSSAAPDWVGFWDGRTSSRAALPRRTAWK